MITINIPIHREKTTAIGCVEQYVSLNGWRLCPIPGQIKQGSQEVDIRKFAAPPQWQTALKVISYATVVLPLMALAIIAVHRSLHRHHFTPTYERMQEGMQVNEAEVLDAVAGRTKRETIVSGQWEIKFDPRPISEDLTRELYEQNLNCAVYDTSEDVENLRRLHGLNHLSTASFKCIKPGVIVKERLTEEMVQESMRRFQDDAIDQSQALEELVPFILTGHLCLEPTDFPLLAHGNQIQLRSVCTEKNTDLFKLSSITCLITLLSKKKGDYVIEKAKPFFTPDEITTLQTTLQTHHDTQPDLTALEAFYRDNNIDQNAQLPLPCGLSEEEFDKEFESIARRCVEQGLDPDTLPEAKKFEKDEMVLTINGRMKKYHPAIPLHTKRRFSRPNDPHTLKLLEELQV